jgi:hypothetical protein
MRIIETPIFTKRVEEILSEEEYRLFQIKLIGDPEAGNIIKREVEELEKFDGLALEEEKEVDLVSYTIGIIHKDYY